MPAAARTAQPMPYRDRPRGHPTRILTFRPPVELVKEAEGLKRRSLSDALVEMLDLYVDARAALGDLWPEVMARAARDGVTDGEALGRIAKEALERGGKGKR